MRTSQKNDGVFGPQEAGPCYYEGQPGALCACGESPSMWAIPNPAYPAPVPGCSEREERQCALSRERARNLAQKGDN